MTMGCDPTEVNGKYSDSQIGSKEVLLLGEGGDQGNLKTFGLDLEELVELWGMNKEGKLSYVQIESC